MYLCLLFVWRFAHNISATGTDPGFFPQTGGGGARRILRRLYRFFLKSNTPPPQICTSVEPTEKTDIIAVIDNWYNLQHLCILIIVYVHVHREDGVTNIRQDELKLTRLLFEKKETIISMKLALLNTTMSHRSTCTWQY